MLFYTTTILLHRPFRSNHRCRAICTEAAAEMEHLLLLLETTFGLTHVTYLMAYCAYTAATVAMLDMHDGTEGSQARVNTYLRALYGVRTSCPGIQRSIDIVIKAFEYRKPSHPQPPTTSTQVAVERAPEPDQLPAFPFDEFYDIAGLDPMNQTVLPFGSLDPFAMDWSLMADDVFGHNGM